MWPVGVSGAGQWYNCDEAVPVSSQISNPMSPQVDIILQQIETLDETDRLVLEQRLHELAEADWKSEAEKARADARQRGINQQSIDNAVDDLRYGS